MTEARKSILLVLVFVIAMGGFYFYKSSALNKEIAASEQEIKQEKEYLTLIEEQLQKIEKEADNNKIDEFNTSLPSTKGIPQLLEFLQQIADEHEITINTITIDEIINKQNQENKDSNKNKENDKAKDLQLIYDTLALELQIESDDYEQIRAFTEDLYHTDRIINLRSVDFSINNNKPVFDLGVEVYYVPKMKGIIPGLEPIETYPPSDSINPLVK